MTLIRSKRTVPTKQVLLIMAALTVPMVLGIMYVEENWDRWTAPPDREAELWLEWARAEGR